MDLQQKVAQPSMGSTPQSCDRKVLPHVVSISDGGLSKADRIRGVTRSLVTDALVVLENMRDDCQQSPALRENYYLLYHYLDYLKRFTEGRA